jgi:hypothetical protein
MGTSQPTRSVEVGRYALAVGAPGGTLLLPGPAISAETDVEVPPELEQALASEPGEPETALGEIERELIAAEEATSRVEQAEDLLRAALEGSLLAPDELSRRAGEMLDVLRRLDHDDRYEEWLRYARAINDLLALAQRWSKLIGSLRDALEAAKRVPGLKAAVAWAEHELGTMHLAVEDAAGAERRLARAQEIRRELGDREGLAATEQSLGMLCRQHLRARRLERRRGPDRRLLLAATALFVLLLGGVVGAAVDPFGGGSDATLAVRVDGRGTVTTKPAAISCPDRCDAEFDSGRSVTLTASARRGMIFAGWGGDCAGLRRCRLRIDAARVVTARFERAAQPRAVTVRLIGDGEGIVTGAFGIACPEACRTTVERGSRIRLVAAPLADTTFTGWSGGACDGTDPCAITVDEPVRITAGFAASAPGESTLTVIPEGPGSGTVTSRPPGIDCGEDCSAPFPGDREVTLTHAAADGSVFAGWSSPDCPGTGDCVVTLSDSLEVRATFDLAPVERFTLTTSTIGSGSIAVTSGSDGSVRNCSDGCDYPAGLVVTLSATLGEGNNTVNWDGCEPPIGEPATCDVTMSGNRAVSAEFSSVVE